MRLPQIANNLIRDLQEFDIWITPSLGEINDTDKFKEELASVTFLFEALGQATGNFRNQATCKPEAIANTFASLANNQPLAQRQQLFKSLASTLFLVTGKSDNNAKCQFPLFLRDVAGRTQLPTIKVKRGKSVPGQKPLPRVLKSEEYMDLVAAIDDNLIEADLLKQIISFLLSTEDAVRQFWAIGNSYFHLKSFNKGYEKDLLAPIVIFKVRGSVSASGGHKPEELLRNYLKEWGMEPGVDFNLADIVVDGVTGKGKSKTRAFDFVLPFRTPDWTPGWNNRILIQSQFYAGDSGSVSHKNVDQTATSRQRVLSAHSSVRFVEYVDGAGYFSSLNGDLKKLLSMTTTQSFIQIRSAPIRLRRELQILGFITPLEIEHAIISSDGDSVSVGNILVSQGYQAIEVTRAIQKAIADKLIHQNGTKLIIDDSRRDTIRRYFLLDILASKGQLIDSGIQPATGSIMVSGYGAFYGVDIASLAKHAITYGGSLRAEFEHTTTFTSDLQYLSDQRLVMMR